MYFYFDQVTKYPVVFEVARQLGWTIQDEPRHGNWDICWMDLTIDTRTLIRMHFHQKINYIPGMEYIARKNLLGTNLNVMKRIHPGDYDFFPATWMLPEMYS